VEVLPTTGFRGKYDTREVDIPGGSRPEIGRYSFDPVFDE